MSEKSWTTLGTILVKQCATTACEYMMPKLGAAINFAQAAKCYCYGQYGNAVLNAVSRAVKLSNSSSANADAGQTSGGANINGTK